jgi:hypothetical protein
MTLLERLKRKYPNNPAAAAEALGLDSALIRRGRARDEDEGENDPGITEILRMIAALSDDEYQDLIERMSEDVGVGGAQDDPPAFSGRPRPGGGMDPIEPRAIDRLRRARGAEDRRLALDAIDRQINARERADADAARRYPNAARIRVMG